MITPYLDLATAPKFQAASSTINVIGDRFTPHNPIATCDIPDLVKKEILKPVKVNVYSYPREEIHRFHYKENGFEFCKINNQLTNALEQVALQKGGDSNTRTAVRKAVAPFLAEWGKRQGLIFTHVVALDTVYRDTNDDSQNAFKAVPLAHVDFPGEDYPKTLKVFEDNWKPRIEEALDEKLTSEEYTHLDVKEAVNIWMPLNRRATQNTLALMDTSLLKNESELQPYNAVRKDKDNFTAMVVKGQLRHKWVVESGMKFGDAVIFNTLGTPHTALDIPKDNCDLYRQSVEIRVVFIKAAENFRGCS